MLSLLEARTAKGIHVTTVGRGRFDGLRAHGKLMIIDDRLAVIGGLSLSALSLDFRREVAIVVDDPRLVERLGAYARTLAASGGSGNPVEEEVRP
jgi:phosphatidylserine/phosphatidylglycerophosphate/cardiolipin synthase-like enzyme